jgi:hypothetical protein
MPPPAEGDEVRETAGITLLEVAWSDWTLLYTPRVPEQEGPHRMAAFLTGLLDRADTWVLLDADTAIADNTVRKTGLPAGDPLLAPRRWFAEQHRDLPTDLGPDTHPSHRPEGRWRTGTAAGTVIDFIRDGLAECDQVARQAQVHGRQRLVIAQMNLFRCRVYLGGPGLWTAFGEPWPGLLKDTPPAAEAYLDLRFRTHLDGYWLHATLAASTQRVTSPAHTPYPDGEGRRLLPLEEAARHAQLLQRVLTPTFRRAMRAGFPPRRTSVFGHDYRPPRLLVADGGALGSGPDLDRNHPPASLPTLAGMAMGVPDTRSLGVAEGVLSGSVRAYRRFRTNSDDSEIPSYLLVPADGPGQVQEDVVRAVSLRLVNIETQAAAQLYDVATDVEMVSHLVRTYQEVTRQAGQYWDRLALHLPVATGPFSRTRPGTWTTRDLYQRIQFVQQVLIQGVADIQQLRPAAETHVRRVELEAARLRDEFDMLLTERAVDSVCTIRDAICDTGYVERTRREARRVAEEANRAAEIYTALLDAVSSSFDERRARETDQFQSVAIVFAVVVALFGFAGEAFGLWLENWIKSAIIGFVAALVTGVIVVGLIILAGWRLLRNVGALATTDQFSEKYPDLRAFLDVSRTERLDGIERKQRDRERAVWDADEFDALQEEHHRHWDKVDRELVGGFSALLDSPYTLDPVTAKDSSSPETLGPRIERWAISALLASERPRSLWRYGLPRLALCYQVLPLPGRESGAPHVPLISRSDLELVLRHECACEAEHVERIVEWGARQTVALRGGELSARQFAARLARLRVRAGMSPTQRDRMLAQMAEETAQDMPQEVR